MKILKTIIIIIVAFGVFLLILPPLMPILIPLTAAAMVITFPFAVGWLIFRTFLKKK